MPWFGSVPVFGPDMPSSPCSGHLVLGCGLDRCGNEDNKMGHEQVPLLQTELLYISPSALLVTVSGFRTEGRWREFSPEGVALLILASEGGGDILSSWC